MNTPAALIACPGTVTYQCSSPHVCFMNEFNESLDANVSSTDREHRTALHYAAMDGDVEAVDGLIEAGSNVNAADDGGYTPLHFAAQYLRSEVITLLMHRALLWKPRTVGGTPHFGVQRFLRPKTVPR